MKKRYSKPELAVENFIVEQYMAAGCNVITSDFRDPDSCGYNTGVDDDKLFNLSGVCNVEPGTGGLYDKFCYHNPADNAVFAS